MRARGSTHDGSSDDYALAAVKFCCRWEAQDQLHALTGLDRAERDIFSLVRVFSAAHDEEELRTASRGLEPAFPGCPGLEDITYPVSPLQERHSRLVHILCRVVVVRPVLNCIADTHGPGPGHVVQHGRSSQCHRGVAGVLHNHGEGQPRTRGRSQAVNLLTHDVADKLCREDLGRGLCAWRERDLGRFARQVNWLFLHMLGRRGRLLLSGS